MVYIAVGLLTFCGLASLAVDYGRAQVAKTELRRAADAAALAGATQLGLYTAVETAAVAYAGANTCDGQSVVLDKNLDLEYGDWNKYTRTFTVLPAAQKNSATALRVTCRRTTARGNALPLFFGKMVGAGTVDITASATAAVVPPGFSMVGLDYISMKGNASASYWSSTGDYTGNAGNIASNGNITSSGSSSITGTIWKTAGATVTGVSSLYTKTMPASLTYANPTLPSPYSLSYNDDGNITGQYNLVNGTKDFSAGNNKVVYFAGGVYVFTNFYAHAGATLYFNGPSTIYFSGTFQLDGKAVTTGSVSKNLTIIGTTINGSGPGNLTVASASTLYATILAPQSNITLSGNGAIYGSIVGKSITMTGSSSVYYDMSLPGSNGSNGCIMLVQ